LWQNDKRKEKINYQVIEVSPTAPAPMTARRMVFPFTAIVGQEEMKLALLLNVIDPKVGGVMIMGDRGTGKSTTIRALADLLPEIDVIADDPFNSDPNDPDGMSDNTSSQIPQLSRKKSQWLTSP
jgi:magnesium chelatase subunit I